MDYCYHAFASFYEIGSTETNLVFETNVSHMVLEKLEVE